jgi:hypothetical protein
MHRHPKRPFPGTQVVKRQVLDAASGEWWRFNRYEIKDGVIQPAPDAHLEWYDPWAPFRETKKYKDVPSPYQGLLQVVAKLDFTSPGRLSRLTDASQRTVLDWCQRNGLLGVLLARWEALTLAPQPSGGFDFVSIRYVRAYGQVVEQIRSKGDDVGTWEPNVLLHGLNDVRLVEESPEKTWRQFFPTVSRARAYAYQYPSPYTEEFCRLYAEPVFEFVLAAQLFAGAIKHLAECNHDNPDANKQALNTINLLRRPISAIVDRKPNGDLQQIWETPSLLASFAEMFAQDIAYGRATRSCQCCQLPFVSAAYQARYCSPRCRQVQQKRNVRKQTKEARSLRAQGQSIRQIASALGQDLHVVKGWLAKA